MSANLDLVRSIIGPWERGDYSSADWAGRDIEFVVADGPEPRIWRGLAAMAEGWRNWLSAWESFRVEADEHRELDDDRVLVLMRRSGRGKTSRVNFEGIAGAILIHLRDGQVTRLVLYNDRHRALADLGLSPGDEAA